MAREIARRLIGGRWRTADVEEDSGGNGGSQPQYRWGYDRILFTSILDPDDVEAGSLGIYHCDPAGKSLLRAVPKDIALYNDTPSWEPTERTTVVFSRYVSESGRYDIAVCDTVTGVVSALTDDMTDEQAPINPVYNPDGTAIVFAAYAEDSKTDIWTMDPDGGNKTILVDHADIADGSLKLAIQHPVGFSPDGTRFVAQAEAGGSHDGPNDGWYVFNADGTGGTKILDGTDFSLPALTTWIQYAAAWGRDNRIAVVAVLSGSPMGGNIWLCDDDGGNLVQLTSDDDSLRVDWSPDSARIVALGWADGDIRLIDITDGTAEEILADTGGYGTLISWGRNIAAAVWAS